MKPLASHHEFASAQVTVKNGRVMDFAVLRAEAKELSETKAKRNLSGSSHPNNGRNIQTGTLRIKNNSLELPAAHEIGTRSKGGADMRDSLLGSGD